MSAEQMMALVSQKRIDALETQWLTAIETNQPLEDMTEVLLALVKADKADVADTLAWTLLEERKGQVDDAGLLDVAKAAFRGVPKSEQLRTEAAEAYRKVHGDHENYAAIAKAAGILTGQSPRRSLRTMDTCLAIRPGCYMANRFDDEAVQVTGYNDVFEEYDIVDARGQAKRMEPKELADEFDVVADDDFRVLCQHRSADLAEMIQKKPADVLVAICKASGGEINANKLREVMTSHLPKGKWSSWWGRARTAAKKTEQLSLSTDRPIVVSYHAGGRTLEEELAEEVEAARMPLEKLSVLQRYASELETRGGKVDSAFAQPIVDELAGQATEFIGRRPADALAAALAVEAAVGMNLPAPADECPAAEAVLAVAPAPADAIADLTDASLWPSALKALNVRDDAADCKSQLLRLTGTDLLDTVAADVEPAVLAELSAEALGDPRTLLDVIVWLWRGPAKTFEGMPTRVELFRRMMNVLQDLEKELNVSREVKREVRQRIRSALSASGFATYRQAIGEVDQAIAATMLNLLQRVEGISEAVRSDMLSILREAHYQLFLTEKVKPWDDENSIWTSETALHKREDELKHLVEVKMLENAEAIGAAAAHGDLSENSEWKFAIEERDLLRAQAARIQDELGRAKMIDPGAIGEEEVAIGSQVTLTRLADNEQLVLSLLGPWESDVNTNIYNYQTPLALTLLGNGIGTEVTLKLGGQEADYRIDKTEPSPKLDQ